MNRLAILRSAIGVLLATTLLSGGVHAVEVLDQQNTYEAVVQNYGDGDSASPYAEEEFIWAMNSPIGIPMGSSTEQWQQSITPGVSGLLSHVDIDFRVNASLNVYEPYDVDGDGVIEGGELRNAGIKPLGQDGPVTLSLYQGSAWQSAAPDYQTTLTFKPGASNVSYVSSDGDSLYSVDLSSAGFLVTEGQPFTIGLNGTGGSTLPPALSPSSGMDFYNGGSLYKDGTLYGSSDLKFRTYVDPDPAPPPNTSNIYGIFFGVNSGGLRGDVTAWNLLQAVDNNIRGADRDNLRLIATGTMTPDQMISGLKYAIRDLTSKMDDNDKLIMYFAAHGGYDGLKSWLPFLGASDDYSNVPSEHKDEQTLTAGDEYICVTDTCDYKIRDDDLAAMLRSATVGKGFETWVLMDSCFSGGFWGKELQGGDSDLANIPNIGFLASAEEDNVGLRKIGGEMVFGNMIIEAMTLERNGRFRGDMDGDGALSLEDIFDYMNTFWNEYKQLFAYEVVLDGGDPTSPLFAYTPFNFTGQPVSLDDASLSPVFYYSEGFSGRLSGNTVPEPATLALFGLGLAGLGAARRRKTTS